MDEAGEFRTRSKNMEAIPGPSVEVTISVNSQEEGTSAIVSDKRTKIKDKKTENEKPKKMTENLKDSSMSGETNPKRATPTFPLTANMINIMVMNSIKHLKKPNGVSFEEIITYMEEIYEVSMKSYKTYVRRFLDVSVKSGVLERIDGTAAGERFNIKKSVSVQNVARNLFVKNEADPKIKKLKDASKRFNEKDAAMPEKKNTKKKAETPASKLLVDSSDETTEGVSVTLGPSTEEATKTPIPTENTATKKRNRKSTKSKTENVKSETPITNTKKLKPVSASESTNLKKRSAHPPIAEMVMDSIKSLKKRTGVTVEDIAKHMEENYQVNMKVLKPHVNRFLKKSVENGGLEKLGKADAVGRYKIKKSENVKKVSQKIKKVKSITKKAAPKRSAKK